MPKVRSPNYPTMSLGPALDAVRPAYKSENRNKMSRAVLAKHLGYEAAYAVMQKARQETRTQRFRHQFSLPAQEEGMRRNVMKAKALIVRWFRRPQRNKPHRFGNRAPILS